MPLAMAPSIQSVRGMNDLLPPESAKWQFFESRCRELFDRYGYADMRTPILESTALFSRGIGEATDIVEKEMYTFADRKDRSLTMRPEGTASAARAYIQHAVHKREPVTRWQYSGPMFRYERMQTGRYRQFYQIGCEAFGVAEPTVEAEQLAMLHELYTGLGLTDLSVRINTVGNRDDRPRYRAALLAYLEPRKDALCADCQRRLGENPLRVLDCKVPGCRAITAEAPAILDHLSEASRAHFDGAKQALEVLGVPYVHDPAIVRGLDYYTGTVFEILSTAGTLGTQSTIVAGGRYDTLVESLGGPEIPAVGFALGVERGVLCLGGDAPDYQPAVDVFVVARGDQARLAALSLARELRTAGLRVDLEHRAVGVKAQFKRADKTGARTVVTLGEDELASGTAQLKHMASGEQDSVPRADLAAAIAARLGR